MEPDTVRRGGGMRSVGARNAPSSDNIWLADMSSSLPFSVAGELGCSEEVTKDSRDSCAEGMSGDLDILRHCELF